MLKFQYKWTLDLFSDNHHSHLETQTAFEPSHGEAVLTAVDSMRRSVTFIDLFAGLGGTRLGFEQACESLGKKAHCVFTSELKAFAIQTYQQNFGAEPIHGDITEIPAHSLPDFDYMLAGFPCQPFSAAGKRKGFLDRRGGLFFTIVDILTVKKPQGFLLENVEGLVTHNDGKTLVLIIKTLSDLGYKVSHNTLDATDFGVPQRRKRVYIAGHLKHQPKLNDFSVHHKVVAGCIDEEKCDYQSSFTDLLNQKFTPAQLIGKAIKDKRGGQNNIHSWDLELKGPVTLEQKKLLRTLLKIRRYKQWADAKGIEWMDGMPLTEQEIATYFESQHLKKMLEDLTCKGYLTYEHPRARVEIDGQFERVPKLDAAKGYNIVAGKLSFPITKILDPQDYCPTIVATEAGKIAVVTKKGVRPISVREGLRLSGFPERYTIDEKQYRKAFDLIGNTVMPPVIKAVCERIIL
jgi:DNA (cytosine-5)-methyltransferase 1